MAPRPPTVDEHCHKDCRDEVERVNTPETPDQPQDKQENPVKAELQRKDTKNRKRNERQTILPYVSEKGSQAKVRKLLVSELEKDNDLPQSNPVTREETAEELFYKDRLRRKNPVLKQTTLSKISTIENQDKVRKLTISDLVEESDLTQSTPETIEEEQGEQFYEECLEGDENLKRRGTQQYT